MEEFRKWVRGKLIVLVRTLRNFNNAGWEYQNALGWGVILANSGTFRTNLEENHG